MLDVWTSTRRVEKWAIQALPLEITNPSEGYVQVLDRPEHQFKPDLPREKPPER